MLAPKKLKRRKQHRPDVKGHATSGDSIAFGKYGLKAVTGGWVKAQQIESARRVMSKVARKGGKLWIRVFPQRPITGKGTQATMGSGKGVPEYYAAVVKPGNIIFEMDGIDEDKAKEIMNLAVHKLPIKAKFLIKE